MNRNFYNNRGQNVGIYNDEDEIYHTERDVIKGEMFLKKSVFEGTYKEKPVAIDVNIIETLVDLGCKKVIFTIKGLFKETKSFWIKPRDVIRNGIRVNYDKQMKDGTMTNYGTQFVVSLITDCKEQDINQLELSITQDMKG
ncbi:MAG: hypothetical protein KKF56_05645 [Nanoarchaeota archaeon]|nr:hypothetical protein [Nanoarchaeota archaeon]